MIGRNNLNLPLAFTFIDFQIHFPQVLPALYFSSTPQLIEFFEKKKALNVHLDRPN